MKIKKVEISAFRIYDDPNDATFDLTTDAGDAAGFISLYAPNGFGKTSFYDAIEYGITESVDRFYLRAEELEKLANVQDLDKFIRNTNSERNTYVKIFTDNPEKPIINTPFYKHGRQRHDLNFDTRKKKDHPFLKVVLTQEWISAFLTESDGEARYRKFMTNRDLSATDTYYNNLKHLLKALLKLKNDLRKPIDEYAKNTEIIIKENTLDNVNKQIHLIKDTYQDNSLKPFNLETTQEEVKDFQDKLSDKIISLNDQDLLKQTLTNIEVARTGDHTIMGINLYFELSEGLNKDRTILNDISSVLDVFKKMEGYSTSLENKKKSSSEYSEIKIKIENVISIFDDYLTVSEIIKEKEKDLKNVEKDSLEFTSKSEASLRTHLEKSGIVESLLKQVEEITVKKQNLPSNKSQLSKINIDIENVENDISVKMNELAGKNLELTISKQASFHFQKILQEIDQRNYTVLSDPENPELVKLIENIIAKEAELLDRQSELKRIDSLISEQENLNRAITDFIKTGLTLVNNTQTSTCPLCEHPYEDYIELASKIANNNALDNAIKILLEQKTEIINLISSINGQINSEKASLIENYQGKFDVTQKAIRDSEHIVSGISAAITHLESMLNSLKKEKEQLLSSLGGYTFEEYEAILNTNNIDLANKLKEAKEGLQISQNDINENNLKVQFALNQINLLKEELQKYKGDEKYSHVLEWFKSNLPDQPIDKTLLALELDKSSAKISALLLEIKEIQEDLDLLSKQVGSNTQSTLSIERSNVQDKIERTIGRLERYRNYLKDILNIIIDKQSKSEINNLLDERKKSTDLALESKKKLVDEYLKLSGYCQNIWTYLQTEHARISAQKAEEELEFIERNVEPLIQNEYNLAKQYLEDKIKNFFHVDLINDIYKKIDPHPDFKSVEFRTSFEEENPRLDVLVKKATDEKFIVPNLYFSTAQINILSLSIFLASALKETEYNCIFIDDPIQSMDNINVLSTIDLLRSIVVNEKRQIILSTHDENFHNLLKKKIPPELFGSKFLELESFGKVKNT